MKLKAIIAGLCLACVLPMSAQFSTGNSSSDFPTGYNRVTAGYLGTFTSFSASANGQSASESGETLNGLLVQYNHGFGISSSLPMYIETGLGMEWGTVSELNMLSFVIPVNYVYRWNITDAVSLAPYTGINFKIHAMASEDGESLFDYDGYKRFQMGWQIGVGANFNQFYVGLQYGLDFLPFWKESNSGITEKMNTSSLSVNVGYNF